MVPRWCLFGGALADLCCECHESYVVPVLGKNEVLASMHGLNSTGIELAPSRWQTSCRGLQKMKSLGIRQGLPPRTVCAR